MTTKAIRPAGERQPGEGGVSSESRISLETGRLAEHTLAETHWLIAECLLSHSLPRLHFKSDDHLASLIVAHIYMHLGVGVNSCTLS